MITGQVSRDYTPVISVCLLDAQGRQHDQSAVVDTGFNGWLTFPPDTVAFLQLRWMRLGRAVLADGAETYFDVYEASTLCDGERRTIPVDQSPSEPQFGLQLMEGCELRVQVVVAGSVTLAPLQ